MEDNIAEEIKGKTGPELFRELLRQLPLVNAEDYCKNGVWQNELMKLDIQILAAHRLEAGAPDPPPLSEVKMPELPAVSKQMAVPPLQLRPPLNSMGRPAVAVPPPAGAAAGVVPALMAQAQAGAAAAAAAVGGGLGAGPWGTAAADLRQIALFVSKWRLEPSRTKALLANLTPARRRFVMQNFKEPSSGNGATPIAKLEDYIAQCEQTRAWAAFEQAQAAVGPVVAAAATAGPAGAAASAAMLAGVKRGLEQVRAGGVVPPPATKARPATVLPPGQVAGPQLWGASTAIRPGQVSGLRPTTTWAR